MGHRIDEQNERETRLIHTEYETLLRGNKSWCGIGPRGEQILR